LTITGYSFFFLLINKYLVLIILQDLRASCDQSKKNKKVKGKKSSSKKDSIDDEETPKATVGLTWYVQFLIIY
jgi:hypothetical protein